MKGKLTIPFIIIGFMAVAYAAFWLPHQVRLMLWPRTEYQLAENLIPQNEPAWGPWLVVVFPVVIAFVLYFFRSYIVQLFEKK